jgi:lysyl-tRNA synthetase class 2
MSRIRHRTARCTPALAAIAAALVGLINVASALTPNIRWRGRLLLDVEPVEAVRLFHAFALPAGAALLLVSPYLLKRRRRAWQTALWLMLALGALDLLKGLDVEETALTWATAAWLSAGAAAFGVEHDAITLRRPVWRVPLLGAFGLTLAALAAWVSQGHPSFGAVVRETGDLLAWQAGPLRFEQHAIGHHAFAWVPLSVHLVEIGTLMAMAYGFSGPSPPRRRCPAPPPAAPPRRWSVPTAPTRCRSSSSAPTSTTSSAPTARRSSATRCRTACCCCPATPSDPTPPWPVCSPTSKALPRLAGSSSPRWAPASGWSPCGSGWACARCTSATRRSSRWGSSRWRAGRSARCASRSAACARPGTARSFTASPSSSPRSPPRSRRCSSAGARARSSGFSMAMDSLRGDHGQDTLVVLARDEKHAVRGVLHFVPCFGRAAMSLSFMRRDPRTPNGLTEFMVVTAVELLRERGVDEMSLNFAAFARWIHSPERPGERALGRLIALGNRFFQIESLYRFNAKFFPRWQPRYLVYQGALGLPRASLAAMWAEGQIPKPELPRGRSSGGMRLMARAR